MEITKEKYHNIINMLSSDDEENKIIGLSIINELDIENNIIKLLLIKKHSIRVDKKLYQDHAPNLVKHLEKMHKDEIIDTNWPDLNYKELFNVNKKLKNSKEFNFLVNDFSEYFHNQCLAMGYDFIESIQVQTKYKEYEQSRELSQSI